VNNNEIGTYNAAGGPSALEYQCVWGLAPNGVKSVTVTESTGAVVAVPVIDNVYVADGDANTQVTAVTLAGTTGQETTIRLTPWQITTMPAS